MDKLKRMWQLFSTTFMISMTANSGYAILSVVRNTFVTKYKAFTEDEMADFIALAQSTPGPVAINVSMIVGYQFAGLAGGLAAVLGCALPPLLMMILVTFFYNTIIANQYVAIFMKGMQYGVVAMLLDVMINLFTGVAKKNVVYALVMIAISFLYIRYSKFSLFFLVLFCIAVGVTQAMLLRRKKVQE